ncbi:uncharacterized protein LOC142588555 [Dermacentor variabilis]|uniref:uncharacterized protein LOC142588555 n=1 Tax=Dermacentor variabilis TaxID=34621 RepID=UPI003F5C0652
MFEKFKLPEDGRTLMQTPRKNLDEFPICALAPGKYSHFRLAVGLQRSLSHVEKLPAVIPLSFNVDGLPLSKSSKMQLWPIQCLPRGCGNVPPFVVGAFAGQSKPSSSNDFLRPFVRELQTLLVQGVNINGNTVQVTMAYAIAEFVEDKQVEVVPATWVEGDKSAWPDNLKGNRVTFLVKKSVPPGTFWKCYSVAVKGVFATYKQARAKLNDSQYTSDLGEGSEMSQGKRTRRPPAQWSDSDEPDAPPPPKKAKQSSRKQLPAPPSNFPLGLSSASPVQQDGCEDSEGFKKHVLRLLNIVRFTQQHHGDLLEKLCNMYIKQPLGGTDLRIECPFRSLEDFMAFDESLDKEKTASLQLFLAECKEDTPSLQHHKAM